MAEPQVKIELAADLQRARAKLELNAEALRRDLDLRTHLQNSFRENKGAYIGGATFLGLLLSKMPTRRKKIYVERKSKSAAKEVEKAGAWLILLQFLFKAFRPMLTSLVAKQVTDFVKARARGPE